MLFCSSLLSNPFSPLVNQKIFTLASESKKGTRVAPYSFIMYYKSREESLKLPTYSRQQAALTKAITVSNVPFYH